MNELQIFKNPEFGEIRTIREPDGTTLFCGKDVTTALGYKDSTNAMKQHCHGVVKRHLTDDLHRDQLVNCIPEGDVIRLIASSKLPGTARFESWIFDEVLPSILHTGAYTVPATQPSASLAIAEQLLNAAKYQEQRITALETKQAALEQAVNKTDWLTDAARRVEAVTGRPVNRSGMFLAGVYSEIEKSRGVVLKSRIVRLQKKMRTQGRTAEEIRNISKLYIISLDEELKVAFDLLLNKKVIS
jgi:prophage antirepressor-like protein